MVKSREIDIPNSCWNNKSSNKKENESTTANDLNDFDKFMEELRQQKNSTNSTTLDEKKQGICLDQETIEINDPWKTDVRSIWDSSSSESKCIPTYDFRSIWDTTYDTPIKSNADVCQETNNSSLVKTIKPSESFCVDQVLVSKASNPTISKPLPQEVFQQQNVPALINGSVQSYSPTQSLKTISPTQSLTLPRQLTANTIIAGSTPIVYQQTFQPTYKLVAYPTVYVPCTTLVTGYPYQQACVTPPRIPAGHTGKYKTELCRQFTIYGNCKYGEKCQFAHGDFELREVKKHPKYKTELCKTFHLTGFCNYGKRCHFIHKTSSLTDEELQSLELSDDYSSSDSSSPVSSCISDKNLENLGTNQTLPRNIPGNFSNMNLGSAAQSPSSHFSSIATTSSLSKHDQKQQRTWADLFSASSKENNDFSDSTDTKQEKQLNLNLPSLEKLCDIDAKNE